jgi:hypothetical protein
MEIPLFRFFRRLGGEFFFGQPLQVFITLIVFFFQARIEPFGLIRE